MCADPRGLAAAGSEAPLTGDAVAARDGGRLRLVRRPPGDDGARISEDCTHGLRRQERRDQRRTVGDEDVPADRAVVAADLLDRAQIHPWFQLVAIDRARQQHTAQPRGVQLREQRFGNALRALDHIGGGLDRGPKFARASNGVGGGRCDKVHTALAARAARAVNLRLVAAKGGRHPRPGAVRRAGRTGNLSPRSYWVEIASRVKSETASLPTLNQAAVSYPSLRRKREPRAEVRASARAGFPLARE